jgi:flagellar protein FliS
MINPQMANVYKNQQVMTSTPQQLTLLLYNGALRFLTESIMAMEQGDIPKTHNANMRVQDIVRELIITLDMNYELSKTWARLYEYTEYCLIQGNLNKDVKLLLQAKDILQEMRDTWAEAMKLAHVSQAVAR